ncbi:hypothetical protein ACP70R_016287 [Stipagrostis hirtigluma subsp. patula]
MEASPARRRPRPPSPDAAGELDSLPPELLDLILCRLPLRDAVRTSALARAWRRRWESVPSLEFRWDEGADPGAVSGVLRRYCRPVREFRHSHVQAPSFRHSDRWLRLLALRGVKALDLNFEASDEELIHTLHPSIFSCRALTVLRLRGCNVPAPPPAFAGLPNLAALRLNSVGFPEGVWDLELLIATSPLLEDLSLGFMSIPDSNGEYRHWFIQAPKLRSLSIATCFDHGWWINDLPSLEEADIDMDTYSPDRDYIKLFKGLAHARKLQLAMPGSGTFFGAHVLECALLLLDEYSQDDEVDSDFLNAQWTDDLFSSLIHVHVTYVTCKLSEMHFIEFVLSKARILEEFHVCLDKFCPKSNEDAVTELVKYKRASPHAKLFFSRKRSLD